jgi:hypothetical protein
LKKIVLITVYVIFAASVTGCGGESYTYRSETEEKPGPGLFSGEDGVFTLIDKGEKDTRAADE